MPASQKLPSDDTLPYLILVLTAISGELPTSLIERLPGGQFYKEVVITQLKRNKLLRTYYRNGLRALRITSAAKSLLLHDKPEHFRLYLTGNAETNTLKTELSRRVRLHRMAEILVLMLNSEVLVLPWEKEPVFHPMQFRKPHSEFPLPAYYNSREMKELGDSAKKIRGSRATGVLVTGTGIFTVYNTADSQMKWGYKEEMRLKALLKTELCLHRLPCCFQKAPICGILFGNTMELLYSIMTSVNAGKRNYFILDGNYDAFHYLTCDHRGEVILQLLCHPAQRSALDDILQQNLSQKRVGWPIDHDAVDESGNPVLFGYSCDMPRILRFDTALELQGRTGTLICFDFQEPVLRRICCQRVTIHSIDFEKFERSVFHS